MTNYIDNNYTLLVHTWYFMPCYHSPTTPQSLFIIVSIETVASSQTLMGEYAKN